MGEKGGGGQGGEDRFVVFGLCLSLSHASSVLNPPPSFPPDDNDNAGAGPLHLAGFARSPPGPRGLAAPHEGRFFFTHRCTCGEEGGGGREEGGWTPLLAASLFFFHGPRWLPSPFTPSCFPPSPSHPSPLPNQTNPLVSLPIPCHGTKTQQVQHGPSCWAAGSRDPTVADFALYDVVEQSRTLAGGILAAGGLKYVCACVGLVGGVGGLPCECVHGTSLHPPLSISHPRPASSTPHQKGSCKPSRTASSPCPTSPSTWPRPPSSPFPPTHARPPSSPCPSRRRKGGRRGRVGLVTSQEGGAAGGSNQF